MEGLVETHFKNKAIEKNAPKDDKGGFGFDLVRSKGKSSMHILSRHPLLQNVVVASISETVDRKSVRTCPSSLLFHLSLLHHLP